MPALKFAREHYGRFDKSGNDAVILRALVPTSEIICAPFLDLGRPIPVGFDEREFIIDPRGIQFEVYPMSEALAWIGWQTLEHSYRLMGVCTNPDGSIFIPESVREWCLESMLSDSELAARVLLSGSASTPPMCSDG